MAKQTLGRWRRSNGISIYMQLSEEDIQSFIEMWEEEFGETLAPEVARSEARRLIDFFLTLAEERLEGRE